MHTGALIRTVEWPLVEKVFKGTQTATGLLRERKAESYIASIIT